MNVKEVKPVINKELLKSIIGESYKDANLNNVKSIKLEEMENTFYAVVEDGDEKCKYEIAPTDSTVAKVINMRVDTSKHSKTFKWFTNLFVGLTTIAIILAIISMIIIPTLLYK